MSGSRIYIPVFGSGMGHASRSLLVAERLRGKAGVKLSSFGEGYEYVVKNGFQCYESPPMDVGWTPEGKFSLRESLKRGPLMPIAFARQVKAEVEFIRDFRPRAVLSDSRLSSVVAASIRGVPSLTILNQLRILSFPDFHPLIRVFVDNSHAILATMWSFSEALIVPDLPPPYTISSRHFEGVRTCKDKLRYVGFLVPRMNVDQTKTRELSKILELDGRPTIYAQISGPKATRKGLLEMVMEASRIRADDYIFIISGGSVTGSRSAVRIKGGWYYGWCPVKDLLFNLADVLLVRGGHETIAQAISCGKPVLTIPIPRHGEQWANGGKVHELGMGLLVDQTKTTPQTLCRYLDILMHDARYRHKAELLKSFSDRYDGVSAVVEMVLELAKG